MKIAIIGTGYVGLVTGTCFAELGNNVICVDKNISKIQNLNKQILPIHEPYLEELLQRNVKEGRLQFTSNSSKAIIESDIIFNCVGTPLDKNDLPDLKETYNVAQIFGQNLNKYKIFINKSTIPVGTTHQCEKIINKELKKSTKQKNLTYSIASNPEFLRQGTAIKDFMTPDRIVIGTENSKAKQLLKKLYSPIIRTGKPIISTDIKTAEMIKYSANAFIATKISFINEMAAFCEKSNINIREISKAIGLDSRIGPRYLHAGIGYGGGCLTKDIKSLISIGKKHKYTFSLLNEVSKINSRQRKILINKINKTINPKNKTIAIWGMTYKPKTDDLRDSPAIEIINALFESGAKINLFDPVANKNAKKILPKSQKITFFENGLLAAKNADALVILTEWDEFRSIDFNKLKKSMSGNLIFDGRNILDPIELNKYGFKYYGIGTPQNTP